VKNTPDPAAADDRPDPSPASPAGGPPPFRTSKPDAALRRIAAELPALLSGVSIARAHIVAEQWMTALKSRQGQSVVPLLVTGSESGPATARDPIAAAAVALHPPGTDAATLLFVFVDSQNFGDRIGELTRHLAGELQSHLSPRGVRFVQWASDPVRRDEAAGDAATDDSTKVLADHLGFAPLGELQYLNLDDLPAAAASPDRLLAVAIGQDESAGGEDAGDLRDLDDFAGLVQRTYQDSLDCPGFAEFRTARQLLDSYQQSPTYCSDGWHRVHRADSPTGGRTDSTKSTPTRPLTSPPPSAAVGALILALHDHADASSVAELTYMGITPEHRGSGLGGDLLNLAIRWAADRGCGRLVLAVDVDNRPAVDLYVGRGFRPVFRESVWGRKIQNP